MKNTNPLLVRTKTNAKGKSKGCFLELFQHWGHLAYCILAPNKFPHLYPEASRIIQMCETSYSEGGNYYQILLANSNLRKCARIFYMPQSWEMGQILLLPLRRKAYWRFSGHPKNPTASAGFEPANSGSSGQYANHQTTEAVNKTQGKGTFQPRTGHEDSEGK